MRGGGLASGASSLERKALHKAEEPVDSLAWTIELRGICTDCRTHFGTVSESFIKPRSTELISHVNQRSGRRQGSKRH